jgi:ribonuclease P protein component
MLPAAARLRAAADFAAVVRRGRRGSSPTVVVHLLATDRAGGARAGFVVSRKVGNSVVRHRVTRRLRPLVREHLPALATGTDIAVRALPAAASAPSSVLSSDLSRALRSAVRRAGGNPARLVTTDGIPDSAGASR